ncbi:helix-turn-helix domain-containing protein [uncultured Mitsuokella sp.]
MDQSYFNTIEETRKSGRHLSLEERGMIQALHRKGYSLRSIASEHGRCT